MCFGPVAVVPDPSVLSEPRSEVRLAVVMDLGGEAEEATVRAMISGVGRAGQTVLLVGTLQRIHRPVLQVGGLFNDLCVQNQVRSS